MLIKQVIYDDIPGRDKEIWVDLNNDPDIRKGMYQVSNYGRVRNILTDKILKPEIDKDGYLKFRLRTNKDSEYKSVKRFSHRLCAIHFIDNPLNKPEINHKRVIYIDGRSICPHDDNYYLNLEWCTRQENIKHSRDNNLEEIKEAENGPRTIFDIYTVKNICVMLEHHYTVKDILKILQQTNGSENFTREQLRGLIKHIRSRNSWTAVSSKYKW